MKWLKYVLFGLVLLYTSMWTQVNLFLSSFGKQRSPITVIENTQISNLISDKTGVGIETIKISESDYPFGAMVGIPTKPQLILSRQLYESFSPDEIEYVVLHESGHYVLWHSAKELLLGIALFLLGTLILRNLKKSSVSIPMAVVIGLIFGIAMITQGKFHEVQADEYAVARIANPSGMISATERFRNSYKDYGTKNKTLQFVFYRANPYDNRIKMAMEELAKRN